MLEEKLQIHGEDVEIYRVNPYEQITGFDKSSVNKLLENNL